MSNKKEAGKSLREHFEAINHREAIYFVESLVQNGEPLTEYSIKSLHVLISGATHRPPSNIEVASKMEEFILWYQNEAQKLHPIERAARVHVNFVGIHPFSDGNGRTSRLLMNFELMKSGFPPAILKVKNRLAYYEFLDKAHTQGNYKSFMNLVCDIVEESFEPYWFALGI
jgi:Fic family protein